MKSTEETVGAEQRLLRDVFRVGPASQQPARQIEGGIEMRQNRLLKARPVLRVQHVPNLLPGHKDSWE